MLYKLHWLNGHAMFVYTRWDLIQKQEIEPVVSDLSMFITNVLWDPLSRSRWGPWPCNKEEGEEPAAEGIQTTLQPTRCICFGNKMWEAQLWRKFLALLRNPQLGTVTGWFQQEFPSHFLLDVGSTQLGILLPMCCLLSVLLLKSLTCGELSQLSPVFSAGSSNWLP